MSSAASYEYECTKKCKSAIHGGQITAACTKRSLPDSVLGSFLFLYCKNFAEIADSEGRTALHLAASTNRTAIVEWLLKNGANGNVKDLESGQTPLHRAIFLGCIRSAILLLQHNSSIDVYDVDYLNPLQYCLTAKRNPIRRHDTETYAFGSNSHYNLGLDMDQGTPTPKCIEYFKRNNVSIKSAALSSFHSIFLSSTGDLYSVGHAVGGRLGHGKETTVVQPQKISLRLKRTDEKIIIFSASKNHSLILTNLNNVYACGTNLYGQLGVKGTENLLEFKNINCPEFQDQNLSRVIALENHSITFSGDSIFAWGQNTGQLGLRTQDEVIRTPQSVLNGQQILLLDACNSGFAIYSGNKYLNIFSNYKMKFFKTPSLEVIQQLAVGDADKVVKVLVMTESYQVYIWDDASQKYTKCYYAMCRQLDITKMFWSGSRIVFLAGENVLMSTTLNSVNYNESEDVSEYQEIYSTKKDICQTSRIKIDLKRIPFANNVKDVWSDYEGLNFMFIRDDPYMHLKIPTIHDQECTLDVLHLEMNEFDGIHDILFHVGRQVFPAHKYVLLSRAPDTFGPWIENAEDGKNCFLDQDGLTSVAFEIILKIIYTNHLLNDEDVRRLNDSYRLCGEIPALSTFQKLMKRLNLGHFIDKNKKDMPKILFDRNNFPELHDVTINCANDRVLQAHKCILVSRLKYFNMMFSSSWMEASEVNFTSIPLEYVEVLIDFLYHNSATRLLSRKYPEAFITNMIVVSDQLFIDRLKDIFQVHILKRFTMKRVAEWLELASTYHCDLLKRSILDFISANLWEMLESRYLENVDLEHLSELDDRYKEMFPEIKYRQIVPSPAIDEDYIVSFAKDFVVDLNAGPPSTPKPNTATTKIAKEPKNITKTKLDYEKEGKLSLILKEDKQIESPIKDDKTLATIISEESSLVLADIQEKTKAIWQKISDNKKPDRKLLVSGLLNVNEILRNEEKMCENFSNIKLALNTERSSKIEKSLKQEEGESSPFNSPISFGDFFSPPPSSSSRMSQKQRKRQNSRFSESECESSPTTYRPPESVWNIPSATPDSNGFNSTDFGVLNTKSTGKEHRKKTPEARSINFDAILQDEKKDKEYFTKLKSKALKLTQLEELAIGELLAFYNADQVFDETIVIGRRVRQQVSQSFSQWARPDTSSQTTNGTAMSSNNNEGGAATAMTLL